MREISKEEFKKSIIENVKNQYRRTIDEATPQQIFQAVSYAIKDVIIDDWIATQKQFDETGAKKVYYLSMEFLMGRALGNNIINLGAKKAVKEALEELGFDLNAIEDQEPDPALGNGGLGRLAACFLDSLASLQLPGNGNCIRYQYGLFRQKIENGYQVLAIEMLALVQAADYLECAAELSAQTRQLYDDIRRIVPKFIDDTPKYREIAAIENFLKQQA